MMIDAKMESEDIPAATATGKSAGSISLSVLFFTDVREDISDTEKLNFIRDATLFADKAGFASVYMPERHFHDKGCLYPDPAVLAAFLVPSSPDESHPIPNCWSFVASSSPGIHR